MNLPDKLLEAISNTEYRVKGAFQVPKTTLCP